MYSGRIGCTLAKWLFGQSDCIRAKVVVFGQNVCIREMWLNSKKIGCNLAKWLFGQGVCIRAKEVVFGQSGCIPAEVVLFEQKRLYSGRSGCSG